MDDNMLTNNLSPPSKKKISKKKKPKTKESSDGLPLVKINFEASESTKE